MNRFVIPALAVATFVLALAVMRLGALVVAVARAPERAPERGEAGR